jgi:hypothetical protein
MILYIIIGLIFISLILLILNFSVKDTSGYNCKNNNCTFVQKNSEFRTKKDCNNFCQKKIKSVQLENKKPKTESFLNHLKKTFKCDQSNCTCIEADKNWNGPTYQNYNDCQLYCNQCHNNLYNSYAIKPNLYYSAIPNIPMYPYYQDPYIQYPYGLEPPPFFNRPPLCRDRR